MCGILGIVGQHGSHVNQLLYDGLTVLQHRGQDTGILTDNEGNFDLKINGLVSDVFSSDTCFMEGNVGIGHVRCSSGFILSAEAQPFYVNSPYGIASHTMVTSLTPRSWDGSPRRLHEAHQHHGDSGCSRAAVNWESARLPPESRRPSINMKPCSERSAP